MGSHPLNLTLRFILEIAALIAIGVWGWEHNDNDLKYVRSIGIPILLAILWGVFAVTGDPSRAGKPAIPVKGFIRLLFELAFFAFATWGLYSVGYTTLSIILGSVIAFHYIISYDRIIWLFKH